MPQTYMQKNQNYIFIIFKLLHLSNYCWHNTVWKIFKISSF